MATPTPDSPAYGGAAAAGGRTFAADTPPAAREPPRQAPPPPPSPSAVQAAAALPSAPACRAPLAAARPGDRARRTGSRQRGAARALLPDRPRFAPRPPRRAGQPSGLFSLACLPAVDLPWPGPRDPPAPPAPAEGNPGSPEGPPRPTMRAQAEPDGGGGGVNAASPKLPLGCRRGQGTGRSLALGGCKGSRRLPTHPSPPGGRSQQQCRETTDAPLSSPAPGQWWW